MLLVDDLAAGGTKNLRHTPRGLVTLLQSKFKGTIDSCLFLTIIRDANICSLFQNVQGT